MEKKTIIFSVVFLSILFILLFFVYKLINQPTVSFSPEINKIQKTDHIKWSKNQKNLLVEYSDFQCPACKTFHDLIKKEIEATQSGQVDLTKKVTFIFRHFPLYQIHTNAFESAYAAEAAGRQGKFYEMVDLLFSEQESWSKEINVKEEFIKLAKKLNLDVDKFKKDLEAKEVKDKVQADLATGVDVGVNSTPTFFLNGKRLELTSFNQLKKILLSL